MSPTQRPDLRCRQSMSKSLGTGSGVQFPDLTCHPSPYLRSHQPTWSAPPTANSETAARKAVTAMAVQHLFYLWFLLHRKFQNRRGLSCGGGVEKCALVLRKVRPSEISALSLPTMQRNLGQSVLWRFFNASFIWMSIGINVARLTVYIESCMLSPRCRDSIFLFPAYHS